MMTQEDFLKIAGTIKQAETDDTPFLVVKDEEVAVVGDANKTAQKKKDYKIKFRFPLDNEKFKTPDSVVVGDVYITEITFKDVFISPRKDLEVVSSVMTILGFYRKLEADGTITDPTPETLYQIFVNLSDDLVDAMYKFVAVVLNIDDSIVDNMLAASVMDVCAQILKDHPEIVNEADVFFG